MSTLSYELHLRAVFSCLLSVVSSTVLLTSLVFLSNIGFSLPWSWVTTTLHSIFLTDRLFFICCNGLIVCALTLLYRSRLSVADRVACKSYQVCSAMLTFGDLKLIIISILLAGANGFVVLRTVASPNYSSIFSDHAFPTLNQRTHILVSSACFMGLVFSLTVITLNRLTLLFSYPKSNLFIVMEDHLATRFLSTIGRILYFIPLYILFPNPFYADSSRISVLWLILDLRLLIFMFIVGFHIQFSWGCVVGILQWQFTKPINIPLSSVLTPSKSVQGVLNDSTNDLEQHLAVERLADLVAISPTVRNSIYSLSHLGGRPVLWRQISGLCIEVLDQFISNVEKVNSRGFGASVVPAWPQPIEIKYQKHLPPSFETQLRRRTDNSPKQPQPEISNPDVYLYESVATSNIAQIFHNFYTKVLVWLLKTPMLNALGSEMAYAPTAHLFSTGQDIEPNTTVDPSNIRLHTSGQVIIWLTEILACLTLASFNEDPYGSVQQSLGRILILFADGYEAVEKHLRLAGLLTHQIKESIYYASTNGHQDGSLLTPLKGTKPSGNSFISEQCNLFYYRFASDPSLPWRVYATFSWALTNCLNQFGDHLGSISLNVKSKERLKKLRSIRCVLENSTGSNN